MSIKKILLLIILAIISLGLGIGARFFLNKKDNTQSSLEPPVIVKNSDELNKVLEKQQKEGVTKPPSVIINDEDLTKQVFSGEKFVPPGLSPK